MKPALLYRVENMIDGASYIGVTTLDAKHRFQLHKTARTVLGEIMRKNGVDNFRMIILAEGTDDYLYSLEPAAIRAFNTIVPSGYNKSAHACGRRCGGITKPKRVKRYEVGKYPRTEETKRKNGSANKGRIHSVEVREKLSKLRKGHPLYFKGYKKS